MLVRLRFIRSAQTAGLTLAAIASIIDLSDDGAEPCAHVNLLLLTKLREVQMRQRELAVLESELAKLLDRSSRLDPANCTSSQICHIISTAA